MSTRDWGVPDVRGDPAQPGSSPSGANGALYGVLENFVRLPDFGKRLVKGRIGNLAGTSGGIDIDRVNRGMLGPLFGSKTVGSYPITATSWAEVDSFNLAGTMVCSGRPVMILMALDAAIGSAGNIEVSVAMDGVEVTGTVDGLGLIDTASAGDFNLVNWYVKPVSAGQHRFALVAKVNTGSGSIWSSTDDEVRMCVMEI